MELEVGMRGIDGSEKNTVKTIKSLGSESKYRSIT